MPTRVTVWSEFRHEKKDKEVQRVYPSGIHEAIAGPLRKCETFTVSTATLDEPEHGLTEARLRDTDVLTWWGHLAHTEVKDEIVERVVKRVHEGMGLIVLHSGHHAKVFKRLMGTTCDLKWREADDREILWVTKPNHPILHGISDHFILPREEMYGEFFHVPPPEETILISSFTGGEVFRSGITYTRGNGKIFYFRPGHETHPTYHDANVQKIMENAVRWAAPLSADSLIPLGCPNAKPGWIDAKK